MRCPAGPRGGFVNGPCCRGGQSNGPEANWVNVSAAFTKKIGADTIDPAYAYLEKCQGLIVTPAGELILLTAQKGICISEDQGANWSVVKDNPIKGRCETGFGQSLAYPYDGRMAFFSYDGTGGKTGGISLDGGKNWRPFSQLVRGVEFADVDWNSPDPQIDVRHDPRTVFHRSEHRCRQELAETLPGCRDGRWGSLPALSAGRDK